MNIYIKFYFHFYPRIKHILSVNNSETIKQNGLVESLRHNYQIKASYIDF